MDVLVGSRGRRRFPSPSTILALALALLPLVLLAAVATAQPAEPGESADGARGQAGPAEGAPLVVATRSVPPFAVRDASGRWEGLSVELWEAVADGIGVDFAWRELELPETLAALERGEVDVAITALTVTAERERRVDFSHPYLQSGLALAVEADQRSGWIQTLRAFFSVEFLTAVATLSLVLLVAAFGVWIFERKANPEQFGGPPLRGLAEGFWWSAVTMTTVGYGDRAPQTWGGRAVALVWMFTSVIVIASFTAAIAASVTVNHLESDLLDERRLARIRLAVVDESRAESYAEGNGLRMRGYASLAAAAEALAAGEVDAMLHDAPILRHFVRNRLDHDLELVPGSVVRDDYAFALPTGSTLREPVNRALLSVLHGPLWPNIRARYLGSEEAGD